MKPTQMLLEWTLSSAALILVVITLRALLGKRVGAGLRYALWAVVLVRLLVPVQLFSLPLPAALPELDQGQIVETAPPSTASLPTGAADVGVPALTAPAPSAGKATAPGIASDPAAPRTEPLSVWQVLGWLWLAGSAVMGAAFLISNVSFARRLRRMRVPLERPGRRPVVYIADGIPSPCLFGLVRPAVYVTPEAAENPDMLRHILAHERTHFRHGDHIWNILRSVALAVHWWNPLVWVAVVLSRRDCELACDEGALKRLGDGERVAYGRTLLALLTVKPRPGDLLTCATTMTGGQKSVFDRVTRIAHAPKRWLWAAVVAVLAAALACVCAFGQAAEAEPEPEPADPSPAPSASASPVPTTRPTAVSTEPTVFGGNFDFEFRNAWDDTPVRFSELTKTLFNTIEFTFRVEQSAILDLDRDGETELILKLEGQGGFLILHQPGDGLCGYLRVPRGLMDLKADGTFECSSSASDGGCYRVEEFQEHDIKEAAISRSESTNSDPLMLYFVDGTPATRQEFEAARAVQDAKEPAPWQTWPYDGDAPEEVIRWLENAGAVWLDPVEKPVIIPVDGTESLLTYHGNEMRFEGVYDIEHMGNVQLRLMDLNGDGREEIAFSLIDDSGGERTEQLYLFDAETLERYDTQGLGRSVGRYLSTSSDDTHFYITAPEFDFEQTVPRGEAMEIEDKKADSLKISPYVMFTAWEGKELACAFWTPVGNVYGYLGLEGKKLVCTGFAYEQFNRPGHQTSYADVLLWGVSFWYEKDPDSWWKSEQVSAADIPSLFVPDDPDYPYIMVSEFAVVDLNGDGYDEVVLQVIAAAGDMGGYLVLYQGGSVSGFTSGWKTLQNLKTDGTFQWSDLTGHTSGYAFYPSFTPVEMHELSRMTGSWGEPDTEFFLYGAPATEAEYRAFVEQQEAKPDAVWHEYTRENIEALLQF